MLGVGAEAPDFSLRDQNQQQVTLSAFRGDKNVLLVFFPLAFTGICQGELDQLRDHLPSYTGDDSVALAISVGPPPTHKIWATESGFLFPVLSDFWPHGAVAREYGAFVEERGIATRATLLIGADRKVLASFETAPGEARDFGAYEEALAAIA